MGRSIIGKAQIICDLHFVLGSQFSRMLLSVILITRNEAARLSECLASVTFADEIVIVDHGSSDGTPALARALGARVIETEDWPGFGPQKNRALAQARGDWVLSIDADERLTPELAESIRGALIQPQHDAYEFNRRSRYCGQWIRHSGWYPDRVTRLFRRERGAFSNALVHESVQVEGRVGHLSGDLLHHSFDDFESVLDKVNRYSSLGAKSLAERGKQASFGKALRHGLWAFVRTYVIRCGFLDGRMGFALAVSNAEGTYYRYLKLWLLQQKNVQPMSADGQGRAR